MLGDAQSKHREERAPKAAMSQEHPSKTASALQVRRAAIQAPPTLGSISFAHRPGDERGNVTTAHQGIQGHGSSSPPLPSLCVSSGPPFGSALPSTFQAAEPWNPGAPACLTGEASKGGWQSPDPRHPTGPIRHVGLAQAQPTAPRAPSMEPAGAKLPSYPELAAPAPPSVFRETAQGVIWPLPH